MPLYYYDDLTLEKYTTTAEDVELKKKKIHTIQPVYIDEETFKVLFC